MCREEDCIPVCMQPPSLAGCMLLGNSASHHIVTLSCLHAARSVSKIKTRTVMHCDAISAKRSPKSPWGFT